MDDPIRRRSAASRSWPGIGAGAILVALLALGPASAGCADADRGAGPDATAEVSGRALYEQNCASCHGVSGDGQGPAAYLLFPKPRNFRDANFKLRSTPQGELPTDEDLKRTIRQGMPGTAMFGFREILDERELDAVVAYLKELSPAFEGATEPSGDRLLDVPEPPGRSPELVAAGRTAYENFRCGRCHGPEGRGDGPSAPTLRDSQGNPFPAADFTTGIYKSGGRPQDLYRTLLTGMSGTPMPSFADALADERQAWAMVYYLLSLAPEGEARPVDGDPGPVRVVEGDEASLLEDPRATAWEGIEPHRVYMRPLWFRNRYPLFTDVRAARVGDRIALLLEWRDESHDAEVLGQRSFADGAALQFSLVEPPPFVGMGARPGGGVEVWFWRADRQAAAEAGRAADLPDRYPEMAVDRYPFTRDASPEANPTPRESFAAGQEAPFVTGRDVGNPVSTPTSLKRPVHSLTAAGFGTLTSRPDDGQRASGSGAWTEGTYRVLFTAPVAPAGGATEADFRVDSIPLAVAVWDGSAGDRNGTKLVSQWVRLTLPGTGDTAAESADADAPARSTTEDAPHAGGE